jgi:hypothetical protein
MESTLITPITTNSTTNSEQSFEICDEAKRLGLVVRYDTIEYRGETINFLSEPMGVECWAQWRGKLWNLGLNNLYYKEDMCRVVDRTLDLITDFRNCPDFAGAKLEYFHNGDFRDIRLVYKGRILKIFLVAGEVNETWIISESERILRTSGLLTED